MCYSGGSCEVPLEKNFLCIYIGFFCEVSFPKELRNV